MSFYNFGWAEDTLATARNKSAGKPVANNTRLFKRGDDSIAVRLHSTDVVTMHRDGTYTLAAGGYHTVTTSDRIRGFSPAKLLSERGEWFIRLEPSASDPRPEQVNRSVPKPFTATDPGAEPVKSELGCQAGTMIGHDHVNEPVRIFRKDMREDDVIVEGDAEGSEYSFITVERSWTSWTFYGEDAYSYQCKEWSDPEADRTNVKYEQCPHCKVFDVEHEAWRMQMHGVRWGRKFDQQTGYATYRKMLDEFGSMEAWQDAYIADFRARREYLKADREWEERNRVPFFDGITVNEDGYAPRLRKDGPSPAKLRRHQREVERVKKAIDKYVDGFIAALKQGMPMPSGGDCWFCCMVDSDGKTWGDMGDNDHLWNHIEERYYVPSLAVNALRERGYKDVGIMLWLDMNPDMNTMGKTDGRYDGVRRDIRSYMRKRLVPNAPTN
jgi:hypothetical protein